MHTLDQLTAQRPPHARPPINTSTARPADLKMHLAPPRPRTSAPTPTCPRTSAPPPINYDLDTLADKVLVEH